MCIGQNRVDSCDTKTEVPLSQNRKAESCFFKLPSQLEMDAVEKPPIQPPKLARILNAVKAVISSGAVFTILPLPLDASEVCMPADVLEAALIDWYGESPKADGPSNSVLWASPGGETWTLVKYTPEGNACRVGHGSNWTGAAVLNASAAK